MAIGQRESLIGITLIVAALSPLTIIPLSVAQMVPREIMESHGREVYRAFGTGVLVLTAMNAWLHWMIRRRS